MTKQGGKADLTASHVVKFQNILSWCQCVSIAHTVPSILWFVKSGNCYSSVLVIYYDPSSSKAGFSWTGTLIFWYILPFCLFALLTDFLSFTFQLLYWVFNFCSNTFNFRTHSCSLTVPFEKWPSCLMDTVFFCPLKMALTVYVSVRAFLGFVFSLFSLPSLCIFQTAFFQWLLPCIVRIPIRHLICWAACSWWRRTKKLMGCSELVAGFVYLKGDLIPVWRVLKPLVWVFLDISHRADGPWKESRVLFSISL